MLFWSIFFAFSSVFRHKKGDILNLRNYAPLILVCDIFSAISWSYIITRLSPEFVYNKIPVDHPAKQGCAQQGPFYYLILTTYILKCTWSLIAYFCAPCFGVSSGAPSPVRGWRLRRRRRCATPMKENPINTTWRGLPAKHLARNRNFSALIAVHAFRALAFS